MSDPVLREPTIPVQQDELAYIKSLVPEMIEIMNKENGIGLAANQVGISKRFFIMKDGEVVKLMINPEVVKEEDFQPTEEGCLSIPGTSGPTMRFKNVTLKYLDENFVEIQQEYKDLLATAVQHEIDHLDGILYIDQILEVRRSIVLNKYYKFLRTRGRNKE